MTKKKYYAVKEGHKKGIYVTWEECKSQVHGYPGALYKSFSTLDEAEKYLGNIKEAEIAKTNIKQAEEYNIYVDGSYNDNKYSWGFVVYKNDEIMYEAYGLGENSEAAKTHNVAGELEATVNAVKWAEEQNIKPIVIHHDYIGISEWAMGRWKTNNPTTAQYAQHMKKYLGWVKFNKVAGHSGIEGNEIADKLAKKALLEA